jgi:hypothetical protein
MNILPGSPVRKRVRERPAGRIWLDRPAPGRPKSEPAKIRIEALNFCFDALSCAGPVSTPAQRSFRFPAHDSLQMTVKYEDVVFDTHRQIRAFVYTSVSGSNLRS